MNPRVWFKSISLENVRSFGTKQTINFTDKDGNAARWNVILGDNGTGKTTVLKCVYISVQDHYPLFEYSFSYSGLLRENCHKGKIRGIISKLHETHEIGFNLAIKPQKVRSSIVPFEYINYYQFGIPVNAYGASRRMGESAITRQNSDSALSLFNENVDLINAEEWLVQADYLSLKNVNYHGRFQLVKNLLLNLFNGEISNLETEIIAGRNGDAPKVLFETHYGRVYLHELNLGYKTLIAWIVDFAKGLLDRYPDSENPLAEPAVCLVDEIDLHLHPKFQRSIIKFLTETFPNTQFIVTAHSPLIVQSAGDANIILLKREGDETHVADGIDVHSWRIDQILSSDLFGGVSTRPPDTEEKMNRRRALLLKDERTDTENEELERLEEELGMLTASESKEALKAIELIGKALSK